jgi:hypothetical protein
MGRLQTDSGGEVLGKDTHNSQMVWYLCLHDGLAGFEYKLRIPPDGYSGRQGGGRWAVRQGAVGQVGGRHSRDLT